MKRVLLVEDNSLNRQLIDDMFAFGEVEGELLAVASGEAALAVAYDWQPQLVLMDMQLPGIDGYETTRRLLSDPRLSDVVVWAITSFAMNGDASKAFAAGCSDYIAKPYSVKCLAQKLTSFLASSTSTSPTIALAE